VSPAKSSNARANVGPIGVRCGSEPSQFDRHTMPAGGRADFIWLCSNGADQYATVLAIIGAGAANFNWSSDVNTLCHRAGSFFVSIGRERSE